MRTLGVDYASLSSFAWRLLERARIASLMPFLPNFFFRAAADKFPSSDAALFIGCSVPRTLAYYIQNWEAGDSHG